MYYDSSTAASVCGFRNGWWWDISIDTMNITWCGNAEFKIIFVFECCRNLCQLRVIVKYNRLGGYEFEWTGIVFLHFMGIQVWGMKWKSWNYDRPTRIMELVQCSQENHCLKKFQSSVICKSIFISILESKLIYFWFRMIICEYEIVFMNLSLSIFWT